MRDEPYAWEKELAVSPHASRGFTDELRHGVRQAVGAAGNRRPFVPRAAVAASIAAVAACVLWLAPQLPEAGDRAPAGIHDPADVGKDAPVADEGRTRFFSAPFVELTETHRFPQREDSFDEAAGTEGEGTRLYSEITVGESLPGGPPDSGAVRSAKVTYRVTIELTEEGWAGPVTVLMVKDWNANVNGNPVVSRWTYMISGDRPVLLASSDQDDAMTGIR